MASSFENKQFAEAILPAWPLDEAIDWIKANLSPEDVFDFEQLKAWAEDCGFVEKD